MSFFLKKFTDSSFFKKFSLSFLLLVTTFSFSLVFAATYYIDSVGGSDPIVNAVLNGPVSWTVSGKYDKALVFDGGLSSGPTTYVSLASNPLFKPAHFTFSSWIFASSTASEQSIFKPAYSDGWSSGFSLFLEANGALTLRYGDGTSSRGGFSTSGTDYRNSWHFITASFDGSVSTLYVDGVEVASSSLPGFAYSGTSDNAWIGGSNGMHSFKGALDDIRFYGRDLSSSEILDLYNNTNVPTSDLIFYLPFNEGSGIKTVDVSHNDGSISFPWKTLDQVSHFNFEPNDLILLKRGSSWNETLTVPSSGEDGSPITFGAYGTGEKPVIKGSTRIAPSNWVPCGAACSDPHIYVASTTLVNEEIISLFSDNQRYTIAHFPDNQINPYIMTTSNSPANNLVVSTNFNPPSLDLVGATIFVRSNSWMIENRKIESYDDITHTIQLESNTIYGAPISAGFYITNKLWMLDHPGEWYYSTTTNNLYVWTLDGTSPALHTVEFSPLRDGILINNKHDIIVRDIDIKNTGRNGITSNSSSRIDIEGLDISYADGTGIYFSGNRDSGNIRIQNNTIDHAALRSIYLVGIATTTAESLISGNIVTNSGLFSLPIKSYSGIETEEVSNISLKNNTVTDSSYLGIRFSGTSTLVENNFVNRFCLILDDCAGIYTWGSYGPGNSIKDNIITNAIGNTLGTSNTEMQSEGIYLDDNSHGILVTGNTIKNVHKGIYAHNSNSNTIIGNTTYQTSETGLALQEDSLLPSGVTYGNIVTNNIFFTNSSTSTSAKFNSFLGHINLGNYNTNIYTGSYYGYPITQTILSTTTKYSLSEWKGISGEDILSKDLNSFFSVTNFKILSYLGANFLTNSTFNTDKSSWDFWSGDGSALSEWVASCGLDSGCLHIISSSPSVTNSSSFSLESGTTYEVSFDTISNLPLTGSVIVRRAASPWNNYGSAYFNATSTRTRFSFIFTSNITISDGARLDLETSNADYYIDNVSVRPVSSFDNDIADDSVIHMNPTMSTTTISVSPNSYCDLNNNVIPSSFTLAPFTSKILLSCFNNNDRVCNNHETHDTAPIDCPVTTEEGPSVGMDAPLIIGTDKPSTSGINRIYGDGKFRAIATTTNFLADLVVTPVIGFTGSTSPLLDISILKWNTSGDYSKTWTESSDTLGSASTSHIIGDLKSSTSYIIKRDGINYATSTTASNGKLSFIYSGGYSTHTFDIIENPIQPTGDSCGSQANTIQSIKPTGTNACSSGTLNTSSPADTASSWNWTCGALSCSASKAGCSTVTDTNYIGPIPANTSSCALACLNGGSNYPTCTPPAVVVTPPTQPSTFSSGGGSGWYSSFYPTQQTSQPQTNITNVTQATTAPPLVLTATIARPSTGVTSLPVTHQNTTTSKICTYYFEKDLVYHDENEDVRELQKFLNSDPRTIVRRTGNGSPGKEISYYGISTYFAVMKYQLLHLKEINIKVPSGAFLSKTRGVANRGCE